MKSINKYNRQDRKAFRKNLKKLIQEISFGYYCGNCKYLRRHCKLDKRGSLENPSFWDGLKNCGINEPCYLCGKVEHYFKHCDCEEEI